MQMEIRLTEKQAQYVRMAHRRWNFATGAVRSGKSHLATQHTIPDRILAGKGKKGINLILGATKENIERNVLEPMRMIWGDRMVSDINNRNQAILFGERVYCLGAEKSNQVAKLRGSEVKFCYCDEICDINELVFEMLKSRLSLPYSECHAACNPEAPSHFVKQFIDKAFVEGIDLFHQHYTIYDNPFLPPEYVRSLEAEYRGTVYFKRYILGEWARAEGLIYPMFEQALGPVYDGPVRDVAISVDYGTQNAFAALLWVMGPDGTWHLIKEYRYSGRDSGHQKTDEDYVHDLIAFVEGYGDDVDVIVDPSATSFIAALRRTGKFRVLKAKNDVDDGIRDTAVCLQTGRIRIADSCPGIIKEFEGYVWDDKADNDKPLKVEDHCMDAMRYLVATKRVYKPAEAYRPIF